MRDTIGRRLAALPFVLLGVVIVLFIVSQVVPVDPVRLIAGDSVTPEVRHNIIHQLGLDRPVWVQFWDYLKRLVSGDLGVSTRYALPVTHLVGHALLASLTLVLGAAIVAVTVAVTVGVVSARFRNRWPDVMGRTIAILGLSTPEFFLGLVAILVVGYYLHILPISGRGNPPDLKHLILPSFILGFREAGSAARVLRAGMIDAFNEDHVRAARARGISERAILFKSSFRNALIPAVTDLGVSLTELAGSLVLIEVVFGWPGVGQLLSIGVRWNDFPLISGVVLTLVVYAMVLNVAIDLLCAVIDPRLRTR